MKKETTERGDLLPVEIVDNDSLEVIAGQLVEAARADGVALTGDGGLLPALLSRVLSAGLEAELGDHLGYDRHAADGRNSGNSRNGAYQRTVTTEVGPVEVTMPIVASAADTFASPSVPTVISRDNITLTISTQLKIRDTITRRNRATRWASSDVGGAVRGGLHPET